MNCKKKINIDSLTYKNNLNFYTILKLLIQCHLLEKQLIYIQKVIIDNYLIIKKDKSIVKTLILESNSSITANSEKNASVNYFLNTIDTMDAQMWLDYLDVAIDLMLVKDLILQESKVYVANEYRKELRNVSDLLSIEYDMSSIHLPYGQRVISSLLLYAFTNPNRKNDFILTSSENIIKNFSNKVKKLTRIYNLNINNMFHIIMDESMNQSIRSDAGSSYESRVAQTIAPIVQKLKGHSHDSKIPSVEYDNTFVYNGKLSRRNEKRTLRERYKQNLEDVDFLDVDYMFLVTLGTDLNEYKVNNIIQKKGIYIVVSQEEYDSREFLNKNKRVISSKNIEQAFNKIIV